MGRGWVVGGGVGGGVEGGGGGEGVWWVWGRGCGGCGGGCMRQRINVVFFYVHRWVFRVFY